MGKFISNFNTTAELEAFMQTAEFKTPHVSLTKDSGEVHYFEPHDYSQDYFTMVVTSGGLITWFPSIETNELYCSANGGDWFLFPSMQSVEVAAGNKFLFKGETTPQSNKGIGKFSGAAGVSFYVEGNVMSLLYGDNFKGQTSLEGKDYALYGLFSGSINVTSAKNLSLPATTLASNCYQYMFYGCRRLNSITCLATDISASNCTRYWVQNVASSGTFTKAASMSSWTKSANGIPSGWTVQDA